MLCIQSGVVLKRTWEIIATSTERASHLVLSSTATVHRTRLCSIGKCKRNHDLFVFTFYRYLDVAAWRTGTNSFLERLPVLDNNVINFDNHISFEKLGFLRWRIRHHDDNPDTAIFVHILHLNSDKGS